MAEVTFAVPDLLTRPVLGTSCCIADAEAVIGQEFWMLGGVEDYGVDRERGRVWARFDPSRVSAETLATSLAELGLPATEVPDGAD
jgi:hypothetical protein